MLFRALVTAAIVSSVAAGSCVRDYVVKEGDWCDKISAGNNVSTYQLAIVNNGIINDDCSNLIPNQKICLGYQGEDCTTVYTVVANDTCDDIATAHKVNTTLIHENNPQIDPECSNIYIGEVLCVASKVTIPPPITNKPIPTPSYATPAVPNKTPEPTKTTPPVKDPKPQEGGNDGDDNDDDDEDLPWCDEL